MATESRGMEDHSTKVCLYCMALIRHVSKTKAKLIVIENDSFDDNLNKHLHLTMTILHTVHVFPLVFRQAE